MVRTENKRELIYTVIPVLTILISCYFRLINEDWIDSLPFVQYKSQLHIASIFASRAKNKKNY